MAKKRTPEKIPLALPSRATTNVYKDSDSDKSEEVPLRRREKRESAVENDGGRRSERNTGEDYDSEGMAYRSPRQERRQEWRSPRRGEYDEYYPRSMRGGRQQEGPSSSRFRRGRSPSLEMSFRGSRGHSVQERSYDDRDGRQYSRKETYSPRRRSPSTEDRRGRIQRPSRSSPSGPEAQELRTKLGPRKREKVRKPVQVDGLGIPVGMLKDQFTRDINSFVKEMNPCVGYEKQKQHAKDRLQDRIYDEYEVHGEADRVDDKYIKKCATKALITWRHMLNKALDTGDGKPPELNVKYWEELQRIRDSEESKKKSVQMGNHARKRGLRNSTKEKIKQAVAVKLSLELGREPYHTELDEAVEKEIAAVILKNEERKRRKGNEGAVCDRNAVKDEVEDRILHLEESVEKIDDRMQVWGSMLSKLYKAKFGKSGSKVNKQGKKHTPVSQQVQSAVSTESENSDDEDHSVQTSPAEDNSEHMTSAEEDENSQEKAGEAPQEPAKLKEKCVEKVEGEPDVGSVARGGNKSGSGAGPSERRRQSLSTSEKAAQGVTTSKPPVEKRTEPAPTEKGVAISEPTVKKRTEAALTDKTASAQEREESVSEGGSKQETTKDQEIARVDVKESVDNTGEVKDRMRTRNKTAATTDKPTEKPLTLETVRQSVTNESASSGKIVILEDCNNDKYVAIGEIMASDPTTERGGSTSRAGANLIRVILKSVSKPDAPLPFKLIDDKGRVVCGTFGEAFLKNEGVILLQSDSVVTETCECILSSWASVN